MTRVSLPGRFKISLRCVGLLTLSFLLVACGRGITTSPTSGPTDSGGPAPVETTATISASSTAITAGQPTTLTVTAANANSISVTDGVNTWPVAAGGGSITINPKQTSTYTVVASGANGQTAQAQVTVTVTGTQPPPTVTTVAVTANPTAITRGQATTLTATVANANSVSITDGVSTWPISAAGGTLSVNPSQTTTYTATALGANNQQVQAQVIVTVTPPAQPVTAVSITANPTIVPAGQPVTLTISATDANSIAVTNSINNTSTPVAAGGGTVTVKPTATTTYTATALGASNQQATSQITVTVMTVALTASPATIVKGNPSTLTVTASNATQVVLSDNLDSNTTTLPVAGGTQSVSPTVNEIYTATATDSLGQTATATVTIHVATAGGVAMVNHVIFLMQENRTFDTYFGMLNPYRKTNGWAIGDDGKEYDVDGIDDKLAKISNVNDEGTSYGLFPFATSCVDDMSSDWLASYGDVDRYNFTTARKIKMDGFVHTAENYAKSCSLAGCGSGNLTDDLLGQRAMGYYDENFLNYYYYMASQFAVSDRWFSPVASKSTPNRIATMTGGTTQGLVYDPFKDDLLGTQLTIPTIFGKLDKAGVSWKIYYGITSGGCTDPDGDCGNSKLSAYPAITFADFTDSYKYLYVPATKGVCVAPTVPSLQAVGDATNAFCIDPNHIAPISSPDAGANSFYTDVANGTLPSFAFLEPAYGHNDEHPGSGQSMLAGQIAVAGYVNALMNSSSWADSVFFISYDEGGGPYEHVPPVPGHTDDFTSASMGISTTAGFQQIAVNPDKYFPCPEPIDPVTLIQAPTLHCDLVPHGSYDDPGYNPTDAAAVSGFGAQLGFRLPNMVISPFTRRHYVSHIPMDHTAVIRFVEDRFIGDQKYLTARDAAQPNLMDFFDFTNVPWSTPPTAIPTPKAVGNTCTPATMQ